jgi:hypothetical protein
MGDTTVTATSGQESHAVASDWYAIPWTIISDSGPQAIDTVVDTGVETTLISEKDGKRLGLKLLPLLEAVDLGYYAWGRERIINYVEVEVECHPIRLERVKVPMYVSTHTNGLIIGRRMINKFELDRKIVEAKIRDGPLPPGVGVKSMSGIIHPVHNDRATGTRCLSPQKAQHITNRTYSCEEERRRNI